MTDTKQSVFHSTAYMREGSCGRRSMSSLACSTVDGDFSQNGSFRPRAPEDEGRGSSAVGIGTLVASESCSFRVRLKHTATPVGCTEPLNKLADVSPSLIEGGVSWRESSEKILTNQERFQSLQDQRPLQRHQEEQRFLEHGPVLTDRHSILPSTTIAAAALTSAGRHGQEIQPFLESTAATTETPAVMMSSTNEGFIVNDFEGKLRCNYKVKVAELESANRIARLDTLPAEGDAITQGDLEWQDTKRSKGQKPNDDIVSYVRRSLEAALQERERDLKKAHDIMQTERKLLAESQQREEVLRSRLLVAEETRVLYQLYLQRLLELLRAGATDGSSAPPRVTKDDVLTALSEALHSDDAAGDTMHEFTPKGSRWTATLPRELTNATLLMSSMLESKITDCLALWRREEKRKQEGFMQTLQVSINTCTEEMEARHSVMLSTLRKTEQRVVEFGKTTTIVLERYLKNSNDNKDCSAQLQRELERVQHEHAHSQRQLQRAQAEVNGLKDEVARMDADRETAMLLHRAAECLEDVRQSVRTAVRSAAHDIEQCALESNTLNEPFIQSMRAIAVKVEAHAEMAYSTARREKQEQHVDTFGTDVSLRRKLPLEMDEMYRDILSPPRRSSQRREWGQTEQHVAHTVRGSVARDPGNFMILEELSRMMKNICCLLENNSRQMASNRTKVTQAIASWESAIVRKMTDIWDFMRGALAASGLSPQSPVPEIGLGQRRVWCGDVSLALGDASAYQHSDGGSVNNNNTTTTTKNNNSISNADTTSTTGRTLLQQPQPLHTSASNWPKCSHSGSAGVSCSFPPSASYAPSYVSSFDVNGTACSASGASLWRASVAPPAESEQSPNPSLKHAGYPLSPPSIAVSRAPTPPPPPPPPPSSSFLSSSRAINVLPHTEQQEKQKKQQHLYKKQQQQQPPTGPSFRMVSPRYGSLTMPRLYYGQEINDSERNDARVSSGAILARRSDNSS